MYLKLFVSQMKLSTSRNMKGFLILMILGLSPLAYSEVSYKDMRSGLEAQLLAEAKLGDTAEAKGRDETLNRTAERINEDTTKCRDKNRNHDCYDSCKYMYRSRCDREDCMELKVSKVEALWEVYELLEDPDAEDLAGVFEDDFKLYLDISINSLDRLIKDYTSLDVAEVLIWLIENEEIARILKNKDDDFDILEQLLTQFNGNYNSNTIEISKPLLKRLDYDKLLEEAMGSDFLLKWFQGYIDEKNTDCRNDPETRACFAVYCKIGKRIDRSARDDWLDYVGFEKYIEDIIDEKINSRQGTGNNRNETGWIHEDAEENSSNKIRDLDDVDDWVDDLCRGLT